MLGVFTILQITEWGWVDPRTIGGLLLSPRRCWPPSSAARRGSPTR